MTKSSYDIAVIGAGIQGAGIAQAAAAQGWSVVVLEQYSEPALGTSSKSSKLIHGGLRYLETFQLSLVQECLREKSLLRTVAPSLVKKSRFIIPVYRTSRRSPFIIQVGLWLYRLLAGFSGDSEVRRYLKSEWNEHPQIKKSGLRGLFEYTDAQTDDRLLTQAVLRSAQSLGASVLFDFEVDGIKKAESGFDLQSKQGRRISAGFVVNAAGPWINTVACRWAPDISVPVFDIDLVQGSHIIIDKPALPCCYYFEAPEDGRAVFVLPWKGKTMVGTTEVIFTGDPAMCEPTAEEIEYLLNIYNYYFPGEAVERASISESFAGLRVLPRSRKNPNRRSRDTIICEADDLPGYIAVYGGKLTAYRATAEKVVKKLKRQLPRRSVKADTRKLMLE